MPIFRLSLKALTIAFALVAVAGAMLLLARPQAIESAVLGADWECTQTAFVLTTCAPRAQQALPAVETSRKDAIRATRG
jgi:F0F1-type ATP synthase assembly protein I